MICDVYNISVHPRYCSYITQLSLHAYIEFPCVHHSSQKCFNGHCQRTYKLRIPPLWCLIVTNVTKNKNFSKVHFGDRILYSWYCYEWQLRISNVHSCCGKSGCLKFSNFLVSFVTYITIFYIQITMKISGNPQGSLNCYDSVLIVISNV